MCYVYFGSSATLRGSSFGQYKFLAPLISAQIANCCSGAWEALQFETFTSHLQADLFFLFSKGWSMVLMYCHYSRCSSSSNKCKIQNHWMSLWLKFESLERTLGQDTNNWHLQQGSHESLRVVLLVVGFWVDGSEEAVVKWCHLLSHLFRYFKSGRSVLKRVIIPQQQHSTWGGTGRSDKSKDATHGWGTPNASTKALRCKQGAPTSAFPQATPLWSSRGQIVFPKPQQHWNQSTTAVHSPSIESCTWYSWTCKAWNKQAGSSSFCWPKRWVLFHSLGLLLLMILTKVFWMGSRSQPKLCARTVLRLHNLQRALLKHWQNLLMNWMPLFLQFDRREQRYCSCFRVQMHKPLVHQWGNRGNFSWCFLEICR